MPSGRHVSALNLKWDPSHERFFHRNSNSMEISFCSHPSYIKMIDIKFCTWHDNCAVVACATFSGVMIPYKGVTVIPIFHRIWPTMENRPWNGWAHGITSAIITTSKNCGFSIYGPAYQFLARTMQCATDCDVICRYRDTNFIMFIVSKGLIVW